MFSFLSSQIYELMQVISLILQHQYLSSIFLKILTVLLAGALNSLTPCSLSIIPITLYYLEDSDQKKQLVKYMCFTAGLYSSFVLLFLLQRSVNQYLLGINMLQPLIMGMINILLGLLALEIIPNDLYANNAQPMQWIEPEQQLVISYFSGLSLGITVSPCSTPIVFGLLQWLNTQNTWWQGLSYGWLYSIGYSIPLLLIAKTVKNLAGLMRQNLWSEWIPSASGISLVGLGVYSCLSLLE